jgi:hypothetical protein
MDLLPLANGQMLVPPELRVHPYNIPKLEYDKLAVEADDIEWLEGYAQFYGNNYFVDPMFLLSEGMELFLQGVLRQH